VTNEEKFDLMPDVYATISDSQREIQERLADVIEMRAADPRQQAMRDAFLSGIQLPAEAKVLEIGCGTGAVTRTLAQWPEVAQAVGVDPSPVFIERARKLSQGIANLVFEEGDGRSLTFPTESFDVVVIYTVMCHVPQPERLLDEAFRLLRSGGQVAVFDGDYATATVATGDYDPLEACIYAFRENFVHDSWMVRKLPQLLAKGGFEVVPMQSYGYAEAQEGAYMLSWVDRGADALVQSGRIGRETAEAFKAEARRRSTEKIWFGHIAFASILGRKPG
jgi:ubiquinone/menaquinone biosynthesis C-methylase UbiE